MIGFGHPNAFRHHYYPRAFGYVWPYGPYNYAGYAPYAGDYADYPGYTGYIAGTFDTYPEYSSPPQYAPPAYYYPPESPPPPAYQPRRSGQSSDEFSEPTVLVFRDGHRQEIANYAIMGSTLFVLSGPRARIPMAELDIPATERVNQNRGVEFHVPKKTQ
jgi:hypothetical protein